MSGRELGFVTVRLISLGADKTCPQQGLGNNPIKMLTRRRGGTNLNYVLPMAAAETGAVEAFVQIFPPMTKLMVKGEFRFVASTKP